MTTETEDQFATSGLITQHEGDSLQALLEASGGSFGGALPSGQYQIGPYTVTPSDDQSGMLDYVVRMQDALQEAVTTLHEKETKINELSLKVGQLFRSTVEMNNIICYPPEVSSMKYCRWGVFRQYYFRLITK